MRKILVIEDDENIRESLVELLEMKTFQLLSAENGEAGLDLAIRENPDLIICDVMMPGLDGYGVVDRVRKNSELAKVPFVFLSAKAMEQDVQKGMQLGANMYLTKPFRAQELYSVVDRLLDDDGANKGGGVGLGQLFNRVEALINMLEQVFSGRRWKLV